MGHFLDNSVDKFIGDKILEAALEREKSHKSSGKLSASMLGQPLQWQILKSEGIPQAEKDEFTLRKFLRGNEIEDWVIGEIPDVVDKQRFVEYRDVVGYVDVLADTKGWEFKNGIIPIEVKSVNNLKFKRILQQGADRSHKLQGGLYALAGGSAQFAVLYVATDDLRVHTLIFETAEVADEINKIITDYENQKKSGIIPKFEPCESWQANKLYNNYPDWSDLSEEECMAKFKEFKKGR